MRGVSRDVLSRPAGLPDAVVRYAAHPDGLIDVHVPTGRPRGLLLLVHGGYWRAEHDRVHVRPMAEALRGEGWLVATPEYRRTGAPADRAGGWPTTYDDVRLAALRAPELLAGLGLLPDDLPTVVVGHSAGGHLALLLACDLEPDRVVALAPVGDLHDAYARDLDDGAAAALMGGSPEELAEEYAAADPALRLQSPPAGAVVLLHGTADDLVPPANNAWAHGVDHVEVLMLDGADHFDVIDPLSAYWPQVLAAIAA